MIPTDPVYITIVRWPEGYTLAEQVAAVAESTGLDPHGARQRVAKGVPAVVQRTDADTASAMMAALKARRVMALAVPERTLQAVAKPILLKRLVPAIGAPEPMFLAEPWRDAACGVRAADVFLLIRAKIRAVIRGDTQTDTYTAPVASPFGGMMVTQVSETYRYDRDQRTEVIDMYMRDGTAYRIMGSKFNFDGLGDERGYSDNENADKLACMIAESAPGCFIDTEFSSFGCPSAYYRHWRSSSKAKEIRSEEGAFEFYSPWRFLLTKALARRN